MFHLWWKENLVKHQNISKYYDNDCLQKFLLFFMSLLTAPLIKNWHFGWNLLNLLMKCPRPNLKDTVYFDNANSMYMVNQYLRHNWGYRKYKLFDVTKFILALSTFRLIRQSWSRTRCWQHLVHDNYCCIGRNVGKTKINLVTSNNLYFL